MSGKERDEAIRGEIAAGHPIGPTDHLPGTPEKIGVIASRVALERPMECEGDAQLRISLTSGEESDGQTIPRRRLP